MTLAGKQQMGTPPSLRKKKEEIEELLLCLGGRNKENGCLILYLPMAILLYVALDLPKK